jgi:UDP-N-acetyl-D-galactosamine dehydrogenase
VAWDQLPEADAVVLAVAHQFYQVLPLVDMKEIMAENALLMDIKSVLGRQACRDEGVTLWRL